MENVLAQVRDFADKAHGDQTRKYSAERYIVHPIRVMEMCMNYTSSIPVLSAALLHDVLEDTNVSESKMKDFLFTIMDEKDANETTGLVVELTDVYTKATNPSWNRRKRKKKETERIEKTSGDSQTVKYADIIDNSREILDQDPEFAAVFLLECKNLLKKIPLGNQELYAEAIQTVDDCLKKVPKKYRMYRRR
jgi:(p)ppGpp synthase/HD superfamily hydrolase